MLICENGAGKLVMYVHCACCECVTYRQACRNGMSIMLNIHIVLVRVSCLCIVPVVLVWCIGIHDEMYMPCCGMYILYRKTCRYNISYL